MNKKGVTTEIEVFSFLAGMVVVALVLILGYRGIGNVLEAGQQASYSQFESGLAMTASRVSPLQGSADVISLDLPSSEEKVCFIDLQRKASEGIKTAVSGGEVIYDSWDSRVQRNVFFAPSMISFYLPDLDVATKDGYLCSKKGDEVVLAGRGSSAQLYSKGEEPFETVSSIIPLSVDANGVTKAAASFTSTDGKFTGLI